MITTEYKSEHFITTSLAILKEFMSDYVDANIVDIRPILDSKKELTKPILCLELLPGYDKSTGFGQKINDGKKGQWHQFELMAYWIVTPKLGGTALYRQLSEGLCYSFLKYSYLLGKAGLKYAKCSVARDIKDNNDFFGGRHLITFRVLVDF